eukprot:4005484-Pleurochrysis_carterae.AAC.1
MLAEVDQQEARDGMDWRSALTPGIARVWRAKMWQSEHELASLWRHLNDQGRVHERDDGVVHRETLE